MRSGGRGHGSWRAPQSIGLGRAWSHRALGEDELHITASTARKLGLQPNAGERVTVSINTTALLSVRARTRTRRAPHASADALHVRPEPGRQRCGRARTGPQSFLPNLNITGAVGGIPVGLNATDVVITVPGTNFTIDLGTLLGLGTNTTLLNNIGSVQRQYTGNGPCARVPRWSVAPG